MTSRSVLAVAGTRPDAIKLAPVVKLLSEDPDIDSHLVVTGQHREILEQVLDTFGLQPESNLRVLREGQSLGALTARVLDGVTEAIDRLRPAIVLVQGDTSTTLAAALAAFYAGVPVGHVESGLRTNDLSRPFPEEGNRKLVSAIAAIHFAPTPSARDNLLAEGVPPRKIHVTGNTVVDALNVYLGRPLEPRTPGLLGALESSAGRHLVIVTTHRRENWGEVQSGIARAIARVSSAFPEERFLVPLHPNPDVQASLRPALEGRSNVFLTPSLSYQEMVHAMAAASLIVTDSGGMQEEGTALGVPVLVMREVTERPEGIAAGVTRLIGTREADVKREVSRLLADGRLRASMAMAQHVYGDGRAAQRIHAVIRNVLDLPSSQLGEFCPTMSEDESEARA